MTAGCHRLLTSGPGAVAAVAASFLPLGAMTGGHASPPHRDQASTGNPLWAVPIRALSATRDRPIFSRSRWAAVVAGHCSDAATCAAAKRKGPRARPARQAVTASVSSLKAPGET